MVRWLRCALGLGGGLALVGVLALLVAACGGLAALPRSEIRSLTPAPSAPLEAALEVTNTVIISDVTGLYTHTTDVWVTWGSESEILPDYFEVWHSDAPYFRPGACVSCTLATTTDLTGTVVSAPNQTFNPCYGVAGCDLVSGLDVYRVRARTAGGTASTAEVGIMTYSLNQGMTSLPN